MVTLILATVVVYQNRAEIAIALIRAARVYRAFARIVRDSASDE